MSPLERRRAVHELGQRAIDYYVDTGECVFCGADDVAGAPHDDHCNVGELAELEVTPERKAEKARQRAALDKYFAAVDAASKGPP